MAMCVDTALQFWQWTRDHRCQPMASESAIGYSATPIGDGVIRCPDVFWQLRPTPLALSVIRPGTFCEFGVFIATTPARLHAPQALPLKLTIFFAACLQPAERGGTQPFPPLQPPLLTKHFASAALTATAGG